MATTSEGLFEQFCRDHSIGFERIREAESKSADYVLLLSDTRVVVEVKQIEPNPEERCRLATPSDEWDEEWVYHWGIPGERIRKKITEAVPQLKAISVGVLPTLLIIYDTMNVWPELTDATAVRVAMFGIETVLISSEVATEGGANIIGRRYGARKRLTPEHNTTISAVGILAGTTEGASIELFHNPYARNRLPRAAFAVHGIRQYSLAGDPAEGFHGWVEEMP